MVFFIVIAALWILICLLVHCAEKSEKKELNAFNEKLSFVPPGSINQKPKLGFVEYYNWRKGEGFIRGEDGGSYHYTPDCNKEAFVDIGQFVYFYHGAPDRNNPTRKPEVTTFLLVPEHLRDRHEATRTTISTLPFKICSRCGASMRPQFNAREGTRHCSSCGARYFPHRRFIKFSDVA